MLVSARMLHESVEFPKHQFKYPRHVQNISEILCEKRNARSIDLNIYGMGAISKKCCMKMRNCQIINLNVDRMCGISEKKQPWWLH
jgi:hypothetical protein